MVTIKYREILISSSLALAKFWLLHLFIAKADAFVTLLALILLGKNNSEIVFLDTY